MQIQVLMLKQDDPKKCTAAKIVKFGIAKNVRNTSPNTLILNPFADKVILKMDRLVADSITGIDCSWELAQKTFVKRFSGIQRKLPPLFAGNPVNYSKLNKLTTVEAIAGALFIMEFNDLAHEMLNKFKWGHTFYDLNKNLLQDYAKANTEEAIDYVLKDFGIYDLSLQDH
jgi:rRNA small subunit aminocarboxypropyltransferase